MIYKYVPPVSKLWVSQGSEKEIDAAAVKDTRQRVSGMRCVSHSAGLRVYHWPVVYGHVWCVDSLRSVPISELSFFHIKIFLIPI